MSLAHQIMPAGEQPIPSLIRYDAACRALAEAKSVDDVKDIRDRSEAMRAYAKQAKNKQLEVDAAEIRIRAERRLGEMIAGQRDAGLLSKGAATEGVGKRGLQNSPHSAPTLAEAGIDKNLADRARKIAAVPAEQFEEMVGEWRGRVAIENERVTTNLLKAGERAEQGRRENDFYPTPESLIAEIATRWAPRSKTIWEPCAGDGRVAKALRDAGYEVVAGDITQGNDFFSWEAPPQPDVALCTNPPFERVREFIDHAFAIGIREMCLVLPERIWASGVGREQFQRHRPKVWVNLDWREDYLGKGGSPDRALAVAIWDSPCSDLCHFDVWTRETAGETGMVLGTGRERPLSIGLHTDGDPEARFETASLHQFQSDGDAFAAVTGKAQLANAAGVEPSPSDTICSPATVAGAGGHPSIPSSDALAAGQGEQPARHAKSEQAVAPFTNPQCQKPDTCKWAHSQASCAACSSAWMKARAAS